MIKVLIVDDDQFVRYGLRTVLEDDPEIEVVAEADNGLTGVVAAGVHACDVALVDIRMPRMDGLAATRAMLAQPSPPAVIVLTTFGLDAYVSDAVEAGAAGFLLKDTPPAELVRAVHQVAEGHGMLSPAVTRQILDLLRHRPRTASPEIRGKIDTLTPRERDVLELLAQGRSNADIAAALFTSEATVKMHVSRVLAKLGVDNRVQAALLARDAGLGLP
ncbi:response regulator [Streptomyces sp. NPDC001262]|uniref:response regulator n=1 Tax=Streptomyces TaxID=1883 RepID=UPI0036BA6D75